MPNPLPYFPFYIDDWTTSTDVRSMTLAERSLYVEMLIIQWRDGAVPDNEWQVRRMIGVIEGEYETPQLGEHSWEFVRSKFEVTAIGLVNTRQAVEREKALRLIANASKAGHASASARKHVNGCSTHVPTCGQHARNDHASESESLSVSVSSEETTTTEDIASRVSDVRADNGFAKSLNGGLDGWVERIYGQHPKKKNKTLVGAQLVRLLERGEDLREVAFIHSLWCRTPNWTKENASFCPILAEWLADEGYEQIPDGFDHQFDEFRRNNAVQKQGTKH